MATYPNIISCNTSNSNTGVPQCSIDITLIEGVILVPKGTKITHTEAQTLYTTLLAACQGTGYFYPATSATESSRCYPIKKFIGLEDKSSDITLSDTPYGSVTMGKQGQFHWVFEYKNGGWNYDMMLNSFQNAQDSYDVLLLDKGNNAIIGTTPDNNTSGYILQGLSLDLIYCPLPKVSTGGDPTKHYVGFVFANSAELLTSMSYYVLPASQKVTSFAGLRNFEMTTQGITTPATAAGTSLKIRVTSDGGAVDLTELYGTQIAALFASFSLASTSIGTAYTPTGGTYSAATKLITFTVPALPTAGTELILGSPTVAQLTAGAVPGFGNSSYIFKTN